MSFMDFTSPMESAAAAERLPGAGTIPVVMNWEERARRAEALLQEMTIAAANLLHHDNAGNRLRLRNAVALSDAHRADLDTLEQQGAE